MYFVSALFYLVFTSLIYKIVSTKPRHCYSKSQLLEYSSFKTKPESFKPVSAVHPKTTKKPPKGKKFSSSNKENAFIRQPSLAAFILKELESSVNELKNKPKVRKII